MLCCSYHELVGVSSKIFTPDGTALKDEPLYFDDPPVSVPQSIYHIDYYSDLLKSLLELCVLQVISVI